MGILDLPNELLLLIAEGLSVKGLSHFLATSHRLTSLLTPRFHNLALQDVGGWPALLWAVRYGHISLAELVLSKGAEVNKPHPSGSGQTPLHVAAQVGRPDIIHVLVKHGARIDATDITRQTPLHKAVVSRKPQAVRALLDLGADGACADKWGKTPAHDATLRGTIACMKHFVRAGLDFSQKDPRGRTILHLAVESGEDMVEYLLDKGGAEIINARDLEGKTPAHDAACRGTIACMKHFVRAGLDFSQKDSRGRTILHLAVESGEDMVEYLLDNGGEEIINAQDFKGKTPLHRALGSRLGDEDIASLLLDYGADPSPCSRLPPKERAGLHNQTRKWLLTL